MPRQAIRQATCTDCGESDGRHTVTNTEFEERGDDEVQSIVYDTRCRCGTTGTVIVDEEGTHAAENVHHDDASWNTDESEEESDD
jgi:hypothetical protein